MLTIYKSCEILAKAAYDHFQKFEYNHEQYTERYNELTAKFAKLQEKGKLTEDEVKKLTEILAKEEVDAEAAKRVAPVPPVAPDAATPADQK